MEVLTYWEQKGLDRGIQLGKQEGVQSGKAELLLLQLGERFGVAPDLYRERLGSLPVERLDALAKALLKMASVEELETWLAETETV